MEFLKIIMVIVIYLMTVKLAFNSGYSQGQIDALEGKIYYRSQETTWEYCPEGC